MREGGSEEGRRKRTNVDATGHGCCAGVVVAVAGNMHLCVGMYMCG